MVVLAVSRDSSSILKAQQNHYCIVSQNYWGMIPALQPHAETVKCQLWVAAMSVFLTVPSFPPSCWCMGAHAAHFGGGPSEGSLMVPYGSLQPYASYIAGRGSRRARRQSGMGKAGIRLPLRSCPLPSSNLCRNSPCPQNTPHTNLPAPATDCTSAAPILSLSGHNLDEPSNSALCRLSQSLLQQLNVYLAIILAHRYIM